MKADEIKYHKLKTFIFLLYVFMLESLFWALIISPFMAIYSSAPHGYFYNLFFGFFVFSVAFIWYKALLELWVIYVIALVLSHRQKNKINKEIIIKSRQNGIILFTIITVIGIPLEHQEAGKILAGITLLPIAYVLHMYIPYKFTKKHLNRLYVKYLTENEKLT